jgi:hypothetical protein
VNLDTGHPTIAILKGFSGKSEWQVSSGEETEVKLQMGCSLGLGFSQQKPLQVRLRICIESFVKVMLRTLFLAHF